MLTDAEWKKETGIDPATLSREMDEFTWFTLDMRDARDPQTGKRIHPHLEKRSREDLSLWKVERTPQPEYNPEAERQALLKKYIERGWATEPPPQE